MREECPAEDVEITEKIIGAAFTVLNAVRTGLDEKLHERALVVELARQGIRTEARGGFPVFCDGRHIGTRVPGLIVEGRVVADAKVVSEFHQSHLAQMPAYLNITGRRTALLLDFRNARLGIGRVSRQ